MRTYKYKLWNHRKGVGIMKRYPKYKEGGVEWIGKMPSHWQTTAIKHLTKNLDGKRIPLSGEVRADQKRIYPYYGANGIIDYVEDYIFEGEHILIGEDGAPFFDKTREVSLLASGKFWVNNHCHILKNIGTSDARFIVHCLNSVDYFEYITGSTRDKLTQADLNRIKIPMPNYEEQAQIANFLDRKTGQIDELTRIKERQVELLQEQRTALINQVVTKGLDPTVEMKPSGVEWIGEIPAHWEMINTKYLFRLVTEPAPKNNNYELLSIYTDIGVKPRKELEERGNRATTTDGYWLVKKGDFIVNKLLAWMGAIGLSNYEGVTSPAYDILRKIRPLNERFYEYLFRCGLYFIEFKKWSRGIMEVRLRLYFDQFGQIPLVFPPVDEQNKIVNFLDHKTGHIDELISTEQRKIELLKEYRQSLISEAVTGKIDVRNEV